MNFILWDDLNRPTGPMSEAHHSYRDEGAASSLPRGVSRTPAGSPARAAPTPPQQLLDDSRADKRNALAAPPSRPPGLHGDALSAGRMGQAHGGARAAKGWSQRRGGRSSADSEETSVFRGRRRARSLRQGGGHVLSPASGGGRLWGPQCGGRGGAREPWGRGHSCASSAEGRSSSKATMASVWTKFQRALVPVVAD